MKRALLDAVIFIICFLAVFHVLDYVTYEATDTAAVWDYVQDSEQEPIDILFMGNSHAYCSINPVIINQAMNLNTMILGASSQPIDQTRENLRVLLHYVHPKVIVLEANAITGTTDEIYDYNREGLIYKNFDGMRNHLYKLEAIVRTIRKYERWPEAYSQIMRPTDMWERFLKLGQKTENTEDTSNYILGYRPLYNIIENPPHSPSYVEHKLIEGRAEYKTLEYPGAVGALREFLDLAASENIPVYIIKTPVLYFENELPVVANLVEQMAEIHPAVGGFMNYSEQMTSIGIKTDDFSDRGHLNREGANKLTVSLIEWLGGELGIPYDLSRATGIKEESFEELPDGNYRYTVSIMDNTLIKFIRKGRRGEILYESEYTDVDYIEMPRISRGNKLYYRICAKEEIPGRSYPVEKIEYNFMHDKGREDAKSQ